MQAFFRSSLLTLLLSLSVVQAENFLHIDVLGYDENNPPMAPFTAHVSIREIGDLYLDSEMTRKPLYDEAGRLVRAPGCSQYKQVVKSDSSYNATSTKLDGVIGAIDDPDVAARLACVKRVRDRYAQRTRSVLGNTSLQEARIVWQFEAPSTRTLYYYEPVRSSGSPGEADEFRLVPTEFQYSKGIMEGVSAAHVFDREGIYTIQVSVINSRGESIPVKNRKIRVRSNQRRMIYVAPSGSDTNSGRSISRPVKSIARALSLLDHNTQIVFQCDGRYLFDRVFALRDFKNVLIGAYTRGGACINKPQLIASRGSNGVTLVPHFFTTSNPASGVNNVMIQDLNFGVSSDYSVSGKDVSSWAFRPAGSALTFRRNTITEVSMGVNAESKPVGLFITENSSVDERAVRAYPVFISGRFVTLAFNTFLNSLYEHTVRVTGMAAQTTLYKNLFINRFVRTGQVNKCTMNVQSSFINSIIGNTTSLDSEGTGCSFIGPLPNEPLGNGRGGEIVAFSRIDRNYFREISPNPHQAALSIGSGAFDTHISSNLFETRRAIKINSWNSVLKVGVENLKVVYNTHINSMVNIGMTGRFFEYYAKGTNHTVLANVSFTTLIDPNSNGRNHPNDSVQLGQVNVHLITRSADWNEDRKVPRKNLIGPNLYGVFVDFQQRRRQTWRLGAIE